MNQQEYKNEIEKLKKNADVGDIESIYQYGLKL